MISTGARTALRLAALAAAATMLLTSCSSSSDSATSASTSASTSILPSSSSGAVAPSGTAASVSPTSSAGQACSAYFQLDVLNSQYAGGAVKNGNMTEDQVKADFKRLLKEMVTQAKLAVADGTADQKLLKNATRMKAEIASLKKKQALADLPKDAQAKFATQSLRVQRACDRAGFPLPTENVTARTSAGLA
ncbi:MAG: hypothetical protein WCP95_01760 [Actinomycetes bacterium]